MGIGGTGINILDRVGGGDAFASGLIHGDANITDEVSSIRNLMNMNYDIKR